MANATYRSVGTFPLTPGTDTITVPKPTGTVDTDGLVAVIVTASSGTPPTITTVPSGWEQEQTFTQTMFGLNLRFYVYSKLAGGSEPSDYTWVASASADAVTGDIIALQDVLDSTFFQSISVQAYNSSTTPQANSVTTDKTNQTIIWLVYHSAGGGVTGTVPSGFSENYDTDPLLIGTRVLVSPGATGTAAGTLTPTDEWIAWQIGIYGEDSVTPAGGWGPLLGQRRFRLAS